MGAVSAAGPGVAAFWESCLEGRPALRPRRFAASRSGAIPVGDFPLPIPAGHERAAAFVEMAAAEAVERAALGPAGLPADTGLALGTCLGGALDVLDWLDAQGAAGDQAARGAPESRGGPGPRVFPPAGGLGSTAWSFAARHALGGPVMSLSSACTSGLAAIAQATEAIRMGEADCMLAGGADALSGFVVSGFGLLGALTSTLVRPFDRRRDGLALGEGAGVLVLEESRRAASRGAPILAEIAGCGSAGDAHHMRGPDPEGEGLARAIAAALEDGGQPPGAVEFIAAHGTGTIQNDRMEARAIRRRFGDAAARIPVSSSKPIVGHTLGAAGALAAALCVKVMAEGRIPPILDCEEPEDGVDLDLVRGAVRSGPIRCALTIASGFAGHNAAILLVAP
jgi:3-oxoacyl-[acyl-carrier-protein] synthase II